MLVLILLFLLGLILWIDFGPFGPGHSNISKNQVMLTVIEAEKLSSAPVWSLAGLDMPQLWSYDATRSQDPHMQACAHAHRLWLTLGHLLPVKGTEALKEFSVLDFTNNRASYLDPAIVCVYWEGGQAEPWSLPLSPSVGVFRLSGMMCELVFSVLLPSVPTVFPTMPHWAVGLPLLDPLTLSDWAATHSVPLANHHHHHHFQLWGME